MTPTWSEPNRVELPYPDEAPDPNHTDIACSEEPLEELEEDPEYE